MTAARLFRALDVGVVLLLALSAQVDVWSGTAAAANGLKGGSPLHAVLAACITLPLLLRARFPVAVIVVVTAATWLQYSLGGGLFQPWFAILLATYALGAHAELPLSAAALAPVAAAILAIDIPRLAAGAPVDEVVPVWAITALTWIAGRWVRTRRQESAALEARAARLEAEREARAAAAVAEERARIARELHDLVAHSMSVINVQAQGARRVLAHDADSAAEALAQIERASHQGLDEMRRMLALLRTTDVDTDLEPQPGLRDIPALVDRVRSAGLDVRVEVEGKPRLAPAGIELAAYRVVQEALTNAIKHGADRAASVTVRYRPGDVEVEVANAGGAPVADAPDARLGHGLLGMRERVTLYDGMFEAAPADDGRFVVRARLPSPESAG